MNYSNQSILQSAQFDIKPKKLRGFALLQHRIKYFWYYLWDIIHIKLAEREFRAGKGKILHSFADLDKD
ncbi:MAG: hypothetical protein A2821_02485 [Candidatus Magasanikbacteria bacterium RIFCSPHIGHO2_01_FULL_41_23]|uniref:Uncharacterized protein n=1 Tax=Candidatus Magasanikbacteria bacterium RIFCSPLOWO2_01_FULL_40_15 TaxID=1798686 RepID=A0A1F6N2M5_9BACT|nr:MAG: hypothetical protein A2821_02485 [Candidatus Magasanikbacteria bacterium RIFCSPHIGHO2_01_FULL_41_23]OGH66876.1 MAG: hypothetical protein A3C66_02265 [Candidatus Magasanikbacteria bacterium RIFCSPHIGHO2_02_FULL_41_35]OGH74860.1 MAG: hypothetical protein A3F22_04195 [Candidatus Magasanikbacteria bacterium RIFCSPHIGHO2_12_FULL_41_16]OGH78134.1 MAG: hypothetical protein A2983_03615 [Candidatus Magasanikbacteria bacterium RIFCSPLOWO2_01_FULL_40_15]